MIKKKSSDHYNDKVFFWSADPKKYDQDYFCIFSQWYIDSEKFGSATMKFDRNINFPNDLPFIDNSEEFQNLLEKQNFICCEQWMMALKALLFANGENKDHNLQIFDKIMETDKPKKMKSLGRKVQGFDSMRWLAFGYKIVVNGNYLKFTQNENLKKYLLVTETKKIYEASPFDNIWGIGFDPIKAKITHKSKYGENLLGQALMEVRELIKEKN